jgi:hypothetical protein
MTPDSILKDSFAAGLVVSLLPNGNLELKGKAPARRRWTPVLKANKTALIKELMSKDHLPRRAKVLDMLKGNTNKYAVVVDTDSTPIVLTLAIRDVGTCDIHIPRHRYDGVALLGLIEKHTATQTIKPM